MSVFEKFGSIVASWRGSRPSRPINPPKPGSRFSAVDETSLGNDGAGHSGGQASRPPMVAASFISGDQQV